MHNSGQPEESIGATDGGVSSQPAQADSKAFPDDRISAQLGPNFPIVAVGASAGGLDALKGLLDALPPNSGMAFILVQHLDPTHESMLANLLAAHTSMPVRDAAEGLPIEPNQIYICPPGHYLEVRFGVLHLSLPEDTPHARLTIDFLVRSLAHEYGARSVCVILSGTGEDGSGALADLKQAGGHIVVQDPDEAEYDGMPLSAIQTGLVKNIAPLAQIPAELAKIARKIDATALNLPSHVPVVDRSGILAIITLLQQTTGHDFHDYRRGTLERRIQRRMRLLGITADDFGEYLLRLDEDSQECEKLAEELLINVTSFFRDPAVFEILEREIIPGLIENLPEEAPLRIWIAACSTGEEAYSIAMICRDAFKAAGRDIALKLFATDVDRQAIAVAREGVYPLSIKDDVPADRLERFFRLEDDHYCVSPSLRGSVVFSVQDLLHDPPFSRIDLVSCRNLMIYLQPDAQTKVMSLFHFALRDGGVLMLGSAETPERFSNHFRATHKPERIYRHVSPGNTGEPGFPVSFVGSIPRLTAMESKQQLSRQMTVSALCRDLVAESYAPASVLVNRQRQCLYSLGQVGRYLRVSSGPSTLDLLALAPPELRAALRYALEKADADHPLFISRPCHSMQDGQMLSFTIQVRFLSHEDEAMHLVSFVDQPAQFAEGGAILEEAGKEQILQLERELAAAHAELSAAVQSRDSLVLDQKSINDEALSVNEEFHATNEELLTSKEELQSLNEELTALNSQLQETLDRQRVTSDDLQNVFYSTNVATLFLDRQLNIRFFTPATRAIFNVLIGDIGRPLSDLNSLASDDSLLADARLVLQDRGTMERKITVPGNKWFTRRICPYLTHDERVEGVVITFVDITENMNVAETLEAAKHAADQANMAKSRFLAVASHDLRQPLQSLKLIQGLLLQRISDKAAIELVERFDQSLETMTGMLNSLLDINQIEAGVMETSSCRFSVSSIFERLKTDYLLLAEAQGLTFHVVPSSAQIYTDPLLLEDMLRNLLTNALKYTHTGKILLGCRREGDKVRIEVWDTGIGISPAALPHIFDEFYQSDNAARERVRGFGLGLSIVKYLGELIGAAINVRSWPDKGSVFSITAPCGMAAETEPPHEGAIAQPPGKPETPGCTIVIIEDDPDLLELLELVLTTSGNTVIARAENGPKALRLIVEGVIRPDVILTDYNLPGGMTGLQVIAEIRAHLKQDIPGIVLTGDISADTMGFMELEDCIVLNKPVSPPDLQAAISTLTVPQPCRQAAECDLAQPQIICVVDDNPAVCEAIRAILDQDGRSVCVYSSAEAFLADHVAGREVCLVIDEVLPGMTGIELISHLRQHGESVPAILITGNGDIGIAVQAMRAGASNFLVKPVSRADLVASIEQAIAQASLDQTQDEASRDAAARLTTLTERQHVVLDLVLAGQPSKNIAADLEISQRTVESHRAEIMRKMGVRSIPDLVRVAFLADAPLQRTASDR